MSEDAQRYALVVLARSDPRQLRATLASVRRLEAPPDLVTAVVPGGREHLFADVLGATAPVVETVVTDAHDDSVLAAGFNAVASRCHVAMLMPEGVVLDADYLAVLRQQAERWEDRVGGLDLVHRAVTFDAEAAQADLDAAPEWSSLALMRGWLRARCLLPGILWARVSACGNIRFMPLSAYCDMIGFAVFLERLRPRGRTVMQLSARARQVRFLPERRSGFEVGHGLYSRLDQLAELERRSPLAPHCGRAYLDPRQEKVRLIAEQTLRLASPHSRRYVKTFLAGVWAARRDRRATRATVQRDLRELG